MSIPIEIGHCQRCDMLLRIAAQPGAKAKMLKRAKTTEGLCVHCAAHDWLRNTYPANVQLARSGPRVLLFLHIRTRFGELMQKANADAKLDEINWNLIVENWELPFPHKIKPTGINPVTGEELEQIASGTHKPFKFSGLHPPAKTILSFDDLNALEPGLGDDLKRCLDDAFKDNNDEGDDEPPQQRTLFELLNPSVTKTERTEPMTTEATTQDQEPEAATEEVQALTPLARQELDHYHDIRESQRVVDHYEGIADSAKAVATSTRKAWEAEVERHGALTRENPAQMKLPCMDGDSPDEPQPAEPEAWRDVTLKEAGVTGMKLKSLAECDPPITTTGQFNDLTARDDNWWTRVANLGPKGAEEIQGTLTGYWKAHPEYCADPGVQVDAQRVPTRIKLKVSLGGSRAGAREGAEHDVIDFGDGYVEIEHDGITHDLDAEDYEVVAWRTVEDSPDAEGTDILASPSQKGES